MDARLVSEVRILELDSGFWWIVDVGNKSLIQRRLWTLNIVFKLFWLIRLGNNHGSAALRIGNQRARTASESIPYC